MSNKVLKDGLGFDEEQKRYYVNFYIWKFVIPGLSTSVDRFKSGITRYDVYRAMEESVPTRGKMYSQIPIWGFENDRIYLPEEISEDEANLIIEKTDLFFKDSMEEYGYTLRAKGKNKDLGTEIYEGKEEEIIDTIKNQWSISLKEAIELVTDERCDSDYIESKDISTLGSQKQISEDISEAVSIHHKVRAIMPGGYGKGLISFLIKHKAQDYKSEDVILYGHNIPATKQMARKHAMYESGTKYAKSIKRIVICSETKVEKDDLKYGIDIYYASDENLVNIIKEYLSLGIRKAFYVNKKSSKQFSRVWNQALTELGIQKKLKAIIDETQEFCGEKGSDNTDPVENPIWDRLVSLTASERRRGKNKDTDRIFNDDVEYFGKEIIEVTPSQALTEGRICEIKFKTIEISDNNPLLKKILANNKIKTQIEEGKSIPTRGTLLKNLVQIVKAVNDGNLHIANITSYIKDCQKIVEDLEELKKIGIIPSDYLIVRAKRTDGLDAVKIFNDSERGIIIGTPWMITGIDAPKIDAITSHYEMESDISASQYINRGQRVYKNKVCTVYMWIDPTKTTFSSLQRIAANLIEDRNSHLYSEDAKNTNDDDFFGSKKVSSIESEFDREESIDPVYREYWDKVYDSFKDGEIFKFDINKERFKLLEKKVLELYHNGERPSNYDISVIVGISTAWVGFILRRSQLESWLNVKADEDEDKILKLYHNGDELSGEKIGKIIGVSAWKIHDVMTKYRLTPWPVIKKERDEKIILDLYHNGKNLSSAEIARISGKQSKYIEKVLKRYDLESWVSIKIKNGESLSKYYSTSPKSQWESFDIRKYIKENSIEKFSHLGKINDPLYRYICRIGAIQEYFPDEKPDYANLLNIKDSIIERLKRNASISDIALKEGFKSNSAMIKYLNKHGIMEGGINGEIGKINNSFKSIIFNEICDRRNDRIKKRDIIRKFSKEFNRTELTIYRLIEEIEKERSSKIKYNKSTQYWDII